MLQYSWIFSRFFCSSSRRLKINISQSLLVSETSKGVPDGEASFLLIPGFPLQLLPTQNVHDMLHLCLGLSRGDGMSWTERIANWSRKKARLPTGFQINLESTQMTSEWDFWIRGNPSQACCCHGNKAKPKHALKY